MLSKIKMFWKGPQTSYVNFSMSDLSKLGKTEEAGKKKN